MERIACKECTSPYCHGCNMYCLEQMLMSGKLDALMNENRAIKMDADVRPVEKARFNRVDGYSIPALGYDIKGLECSNCGATYIAQTWVRKFNYCPNCGARMEANDV